MYARSGGLEESAGVILIKEIIVSLGRQDPPPLYFKVESHSVAKISYKCNNLISEEVYGNIWKHLRRYLATERLLYPPALFQDSGTCTKYRRMPVWSTPNRTMHDLPKFLCKRENARGTQCGSWPCALVIQKPQESQDCQKSRTVWITKKNTQDRNIQRWVF